MSKPKLLYNREEMLKLNIEVLQNRCNVTVMDIATIAHQQQSKYYKGVDIKLCIESVEKILTFRDVFHHIQFAAEVDRLAEEKMFKGPIQDILYYDLGLFGLDETLGLDVARNYGAIGQTNFGDIDVNKRGVVARLNEDGKKDGVVHTLMDDIVGAIAAAASTRVAQVMNEDLALENPSYQKISLFDLKNSKKGK
ncbi:Phosphatidylglycerophosphatase A [Acholeplasma oculi]|uniref:Putative phosphatidylglycerophosphatase A, PgpA n=1 Tax=Acholeplasma oculi TaxID=35623 RepID=A0A061ABE4_9MOLU|nr:phosphatidylglycerophosphatase A [Acholeplasma oculi]CDR31185.1 Putative phosphatidylglycerophosphatase A, PgpA [Acholeplasma oculi]SKC37785.1 phosphatidylglycerophosphatase A [Acholeplasma oculi]SUT91087.1 Phosphatidylglycerophosphatase A [Acholeplasma oculi]